MGIDIHELIKTEVGDYEMNWKIIFDLVKARHPEQVHYKVGENLAACDAGGDRTTQQNWGEYLTDDKTEVGCKPCVEWMHA